MSEALNKVDARVKALEVKVVEAISFDDDNAAVLPETFDKDNLAIASGTEDLSIEQVKLVQETAGVFASALALGLGNASLPVMKKNADVQRTTASLSYGHDVVRVSVDRQQTVRNPTTGEEKQKFGATSVKLDSGAAAKKGDLKRVLTAITDNFTAALGN